MPFTVITLKKVPESLRGDLTRWMQEITTGVYVGNYNSRIREYLWKRVTDTVGNGEAMICYSCGNEIGYSFLTCNSERQVVDFDGIPLVLIPSKNKSEDNHEEIQLGFSNASKYQKKLHKGRSQSSLGSRSSVDDRLRSDRSMDTKQGTAKLVFLDIETTGLNYDVDQIIEIGAIKTVDGNVIEFHRILHADIHISEEVRNLTGITDEILKDGKALETSIREFSEFIEDSILVGYNLSFDLRFLNKAMEKQSLEPIHNRTIELIHEAKKRNSYQTNYKFETTLKEYGIDQKVPHRALEDAKLIYHLFIQMGLA